MQEDWPPIFDRLRPSRETQLLAEYAEIKPGERALEVGCGSGYITLRLAWRFPGHRTIIGFDLQRDKIAEALNWKKRIEELLLKPLTNVHFLVWDAVSPARLGNGFDVLVCNPPFFAKQASRPAHQADRRLARRDDALPPDTLLDCAAAQLVPSGRLYLVYPQNRLNEIAAIAQRKGFAIAAAETHENIRRRSGGICLMQCQTEPCSKG
ncbi:MAG: methyltransferase domain-containing protein [Candidatus Omnitrophota bacterium]